MEGQADLLFLVLVGDVEEQESATARAEELATARTGFDAAFIGVVDEG